MNVDGTWRLTIDAPGEEMLCRLDLSVDGDRVTGRIRGLALDGSIERDRLQFIARQGERPYATFDGRIGEAALAGTVHVRERALPWVARRPTVWTAPSRRHVFAPVVFHDRYSAAMEPALRINPGDSVATSTLDHRGYDADGRLHATAGNPLTGPFYIDGALPGDTLAVTFERIQPNREQARSSNRLAPAAITSDYHRDAQYVLEELTEWRLDADRGWAMLATPSARLTRFRVPLRPFLGCVGVAPMSGQEIRASGQGAWGGNLDYSGLCPNTTIYLPVYAPGALLFIGDGHAAQGDGEVTGTALETSMDVEFTVRIISGLDQEMPAGPLAENADYRMAMGVAGSLSEALRVATSQLAAWLGRDYRLDAHETALVLGAAIEVDVAQVVAPQVHVVAKISRTVLAALASDAESV